jgi:hypothetical protein
VSTMASGSDQFVQLQGASAGEYTKNNYLKLFFGYFKAYKQLSAHPRGRLGAVVAF